MERNDVYSAIDFEREYQELGKRNNESHIVEDFGLGSAMRKIMNDMEDAWYYEKAPYSNSMELMRKIAGIATQMGEQYGMPSREILEEV